MPSSHSKKKRYQPPSTPPPSVDAVNVALGSVRLAAEELQQFTESLTRPHHSVLRVRREIDPERLPITTEPIQWYTLGWRSTEPDAKPSRHLNYFAGDYYLQDAGSLLALAACGADQTLLGDSPQHASQPLLVCDLCASPGGKATALLEALGDEGFLLANEPIQSRLAPLSYNLSKCGSDRYAISNLDPDSLADRLGGVFDLVVVDAPCSGQALLAKGKQSAAALSTRQIEHSAARQSRILSAATRLLRESGRLVYSTCTFAEAENEDQARRLVDEHAMEPVPVERLRSYASEVFAGTYRLWPHRNNCAGSFAASLQATTAGTVPRRWKGRKAERPPADLDPWFAFPATSPRFQTIGSLLFGWAHDAPAWVEDVAMGGPELAHCTGNTWKPAHTAALRRDGFTIARQRIDVDAQTAIEFLRGNPIACQEKGWQVVCLENRPIGWIKGSSGIGKNQLFPAARVTGPIKS